MIDARFIEVIVEVESLLKIPVYLVGGAVRDILLGKEPKDWDFTTPVSPEVVEQKIINIGKRPYLLGKKFGTIGFKMELEGKSQLVEITTFRAEKYTQGSRKPEVVFTDNLSLDLNRRDFSINALALNSKGKLYDNWGGQQDLQDKIIRAVDNPKIRFNEDPLRILRALRFATILDFEIEELTWEKLCKMKYSIFDISKERWVMELDKILSAKNVEKGLDLLMDSGVLGVIMPELSLQKNYNQNSPHHDFDLWTHTKKVLSGVSAEDLNLRWTALLHDIAKPFTRTENKNGNSNYLNHDILGSQMALKVCNYLKFSNDRTKFITENILNHLKPESPLKVHDDGGKKIKTN
jgi:tRNA nucleotidyltransferase (CCA-adding enzyme)